MVATFVFACCDQQTPCTTHVDADGDKVCDKCGTTIKDDLTPDPGTDPKPPHSLIATPLEKASEPSIAIHYKRNDQDYDSWGYWLWAQGADGQIFVANNVDDYGSIACYPISDIGPNALTTGIGLIPRRVDVDANTWIKDMDVDRFVDFSNYVIDENNYYHIYIKQGDENLYIDSEFNMAELVKSASFVSINQIRVQATTALSLVEIFQNDTSLIEKQVAGVKVATVALPDGVKGDISQTYSVKVTFKSGKTATLSVSTSGLFSTEEFGAMYNYDGDDLGAVYTQNSTTFKVWSPVSQSITLNLYAEGSGDCSLGYHEMVLGEKGVWSVTVEGDLSQIYYTYTVVNSKYPNGKEIVDPYAKSAGVNGLRGQIVDFSDTNPEGWENSVVPAYDSKELVVWETHVADVTSSSTWNGTEAYRKKFLGMTESGTTYKQNGVTVSTGFDHIKELGVNAVQLVPIFDQDNDEVNTQFNWGYNPLNYNVVEGCYSTNPHDGYVRINEFKQLVQAYNNAGIGIIMDVVYNHTSSNVGSNFDVLMPGYYYRYNVDGSSSSGSGCGNDTASEHYMFRKFMIDSVCFWAKEYKLMGFRFDLMGLHDLETMNQLVDALQEINPNIVVYGEPWTMTTATNATLANQPNANSYKGFGQFNDQMRDAMIKGGMSGVAETGWVTGVANIPADINKILSGLKGATTNATTDPDKTVNYATCHDNYTLYDRIKVAGISDETTAKNMAMLANSLVLLSNGTSFILAGEEFLRTKGGDHNSYQSSYEVNELDYSLKIKHMDMFQNYQKLIALKKSASGLHLTATEVTDANFKVTSSTLGDVITVVFVDTTTNREYKVVFANGSADGAMANFDGYTLYLDTLGINTALSSNTMVSPYQTIIGYKSL